MSLAQKINRVVAPFEVVSEFQPSGDQPKAITELAERINAGEKDVVLMGATGTGKSATAAWLVEQVQRPTLIMVQNKTLAAQLANEFRELLPNNAVEYFVSYYDYYQPEAYVPQTDTFIEKDSSINEEVERLRHSATNALLTRRDVVVVATVSCIYGLGTPEEYIEQMVTLQRGQQMDRDDLLRQFVKMQYVRNDTDFHRGTFRVRGDTVEIIPMYEELAVRIEFFGDEIDSIQTLHPLTGQVVREEEEMYIFPASHYVAGDERMHRAITSIEDELRERLQELESQNKLLEAQRLRMRTTYDLEMMQQMGYCNGIENYSLHIDGRPRGSAPHCLLDYFPDDFLLVVDESHVTIPQIGAMFEGDMSRKRTLVEHGFRLPSAMDNRPLKWDEFLERIGQTVYMSATPGKYELAQADGVVEQIIRPTGLVDPEVVVKPTKGQIDDLLEEIRVRTEKDERVLVTTLTKRMAEDLTEYLLEHGVQVQYLHSDVDTLKRVELLRELRKGTFDVLVGINLLREGLDLPEVSLVAILDADKEGFLRSSTSLIQTIGRAARNVSGQVHMYADRITDSMRLAIDETNRRREVQEAYNKEHGIDPTPLRKRIADITDQLAREDADTADLLGGMGGIKVGFEYGAGKRGYTAAITDEQRAKAAAAGAADSQDHDGGSTPASAANLAALPAKDLEDLIAQMSAQMHQAAVDLQFELAARIRDEVAELKKELRQIKREGHA
ncbi:excinuclease ABC subunit UvrB [Micrococcus terreus]|uniref:excinuclease ABC subunit UvrB n=1 Tax=Micrococcus terreus TaxID=574650 RepID=UPI002551C57A|nr:excinuclease ABC subunit UvrB [Micrococcus terreus]MDK7699838.1 excinuclease ABC subunit UvrB [Micrococcus terreus]WOO98233.1 excinuclease ABC subunit UvrB [Micrococcus terreus]